MTFFSIIDNLVTLLLLKLPGKLLEDFNVLMLTSCRFVDCHVNLGDNLE